MAENLKLKNTIQVDGIEYDINAKHSDEANKVAKALIVKESGTDAFEFDGSIEHTIDYVPADKGGTFKQSIYVGEQTAGNALITLNQLDNRVTELTGTSVCTWDAETCQLIPLVNDDTSSIYNFITIQGTADDFSTFNKIFVSGDGLHTRGIRFSHVVTAPTCKIAGFNEDATDAELDVILPYRAKFTSPTTGEKFDKAVVGLTEGAFGPEESYQLEGAPITSVVIPECIKIISKEAFKYCKQLSRVTMFSGVTTIAEGAFYGCTALRTVVIPASITSIEKDAFAGCENITIYYGGSEAQWENIAISHSYNNDNIALKTANILYNQSIAKTNLSGPFIYICRDSWNDLTASNKVFLKFPDESQSLIELSKNATRLDSTVAEQNYYTYEGLAEIIARINTRLDGLGIGVNTTVLAPMYSVEDVNKLVPEVEITESFDPDAVPTIDQLDTDIDKLREDLEALDKKVEFELTSGDSIAGLTNRLNALEAKFTILEQLGSTNVNRLLQLIDSIDWTEA